MKYRKKPGEVEAVQVASAIRDSRDRFEHLPRWLRDAYEEGFVLFAPAAVHLKNNQQWQQGDPGDWLVFDNGYLYLCSGKHFRGGYE